MTGAEIKAGGGLVPGLREFQRVDHHVGHEGNAVQHGVGDIRGEAALLGGKGFSLEGQDFFSFFRKVTADLSRGPFKGDLREELGVAVELDASGSRDLRSHRQLPHMGGEAPSHHLPQRRQPRDLGFFKGDKEGDAELVVGADVRLPVFEGREGRHASARGHFNRMHAGVGQKRSHLPRRSREDGREGRVVIIEHGQLERFPRPVELPLLDPFEKLSLHGAPPDFSFSMAATSSSALSLDTGRRDNTAASRMTFSRPKSLMYP